MNKLRFQTVSVNPKPSRDQAEEAVRTLIRWAGDNPARDGLQDTPRRVIDSYQELFSGYTMSLDSKICKTFPNFSAYEDMIMLKNIRLESCCEHHMSPIIGAVTIAYIPDDKIIGLSKLARIVDYHAKRLQIQERLTIEIAKTLNEIVDPCGVGVVIESSHHCMTTRGVHKPGSLMRTSHMIGCFKEKEVRKEFLDNAFE